MVVAYPIRWYCMIRLATVDDVPQLVALTKSFAESQNMLDDLDVKTAAKVHSLAIRDALSYVSERDGRVVGVIAGLKSPNLWNNYKIQIDEIIYYVDPEYRRHRDSLKLLKVYTDKIKDQCYVSTLKLMANSPDLKRYYKKLGYVETETTFMRLR